LTIGLRLKQGQIPPFDVFFLLEAGKGRRGGIFLIRNMKRCVKNFSGERKDHMYGELKNDFYKCL
jgi:hypothetical protein